MTLLSANHYWRIVAAGFCYAVFAIGVFIPGVYVLGLALFPIDASAKQIRVRKVIQRLCRFYIHLIQFFGVLEVQVTNNNQSELKAHLVICNHSSLIDALFVLAYVDNLCCVVKDQLCHNPFTRIPVKLAGYISNGANDFINQACRKIEAGENLLIFPEGTRNQYDTQLDFKRGAANIAVISGCQILPMLILAIPRMVQKGESWYQLPTEKSRFIIKLNSSMRCQNHIDTNLPRTLQYRRLTDYWRDYYRAEITNIG